MPALGEKCRCVCYRNQQNSGGQHEPGMRLNHFFDGQNTIIHGTFCHINWLYNCTSIVLYVMDQIFESREGFLELPLKRATRYKSWPVLNGTSTSAQRPNCSWRSNIW